MIKTTKFSILATILLSFSLIFTNAHAVDSSVDTNAIAENAEDFFDVSFGDMQEEMMLAKEEGKAGIVVMFETEDCPWCTRMKQQVLNRVAVQEYYGDHFRVISLDAGGDVPMTDFEGNEVTEKQFSLETLRVRATPVFAFFDTEGNLITRHTGTLKNAHDFLLLGEYVVEGHHISTSFKKYRRSQQSS